MAVTTARVPVTTTATKIAENTASAALGDEANKSFGLIPVGVTALIYLGPAGVTTANGVQWDTAEIGPISVELEPGESIYGIAASGSQNVHVLGTGR